MADQIYSEISIIGVGGHGSNAFIELLTNPLFSNTKVNVVIGSDDSGGHTGILQKVLEKMYPGTDPAKFLPVGDLRGNISRLLFYKGEIVYRKDPEAKLLYSGLADLMNERVTYIGNDQKFLDKCQEFCIRFGLEDKCADFLDFCKLYLQNLSSDSELSVKHSLGNLFLSYMIVERHRFNLESVFDELKNFQLIPENVYFHYFSEERLILRAGYEIKTANSVREVIYEGEHNVDKAPHPLFPHKYQLKRMNGEIVTECDERIRNVINNSGLLVLSCGSVANLLGQVNIAYDVLREYHGEIVWIANIFKGRNEVGIETLAEYFLELGINPHILTLDRENLEALYRYNGLSKNALKEYAGEGKSVNDLYGLEEVLDDYNAQTGRAGIVVPILSVLPNRYGNLSKLSRTNISDSGRVEELVSAIGNIGIKHESKVLSILLDFMNDFSRLLKSELKFDKEVSRQIFVDFIKGLARNCTVDRAYTEIMILCRIMASEVSPYLKFSKLSKKLELFKSMDDELFVKVYEHYKFLDDELFDSENRETYLSYNLQEQAEGRDDGGNGEMGVR